MTISDVLPLEDCIQPLKRINHSIKIPKDVAQIYVAALSLFCHLKKEQETLFRRAHERESFPPMDQIPAMSAVLSDPRLFASLLRCLKAPPADQDSSHEATRRNRPGPPSHLPTNKGVSRKRGMSFSEDSVVSKVAKTSATVSPMMVKTKVDVGQEASELPIQIIAASIFYVSLQPMNHWPAPVVQAYAEDAFGPRLWVDRPECHDFVANLRLVHDKNAPSDESQEMKEEGEQVADYYANMMLNVPPEEPPSRRGSLSSGIRQPPSGVMRSISQASSSEPAFPDDDDSDSGVEEIVEVSMGTVVKPSASTRGSEDSSSSGEEEVVMTVDNSGDDFSKKPLEQAHPYPVPPKEINLKRIRRRYFASNHEMCLIGITTALAERLDSKSKQNSRLLQSLPEFCTVPGVRVLTAGNLEKWLQSPALSGSARILFACTVEHMENCDPPLLDDLDAIDAILDMKLKANQLNMHIDNVTEIAKRLPTSDVSRQIYLKLIRNEISSMDDPSKTTEHLQMMSAVHGAFSQSVSNDGIASAILTLLADPDSSSGAMRSRDEQFRLVKKTKAVLRRLFEVLQSQFDGCGLVKSLMSFDVSAKSWSIRDEEDKARIMLECVALHAPGPMEEPGRGKSGKNMKKFLRPQDTENGISQEEIEKLRKFLMTARKLFITWCVMDYAPLCQMEKQCVRNLKKQEIIVGAGMPDFSSVLDQEAALSKESTCPDSMKCILFMVDPESASMQGFLYPEGLPSSAGSDWNEEMYRLKQCYRYGADLDDKMLSIILSASTGPDQSIDSAMALALIEHLFECCRIGGNAKLSITDVDLAWEMYKLAEFQPGETALSGNRGGHQENSDDQFADADEEGTIDKPNENGNTSLESIPLGPRLAYPGIWWRVTALSLIMTGASLAGIGAELCEQHPTLRELIKMVTSARYRFPTVDCDDSKREEMKKAENEMREMESKAAELLFLPPLPKPNDATEQKVVPHGPRVSVRQKQRQERILRETREKEAAEAEIINKRRRKDLKVAQRTIMVWDPRGPARKPPKESVNLILSVEKMFGLSRTFQESVKPDLVLASIGDTSRGAIERAYDWLIPVISTVPSVIARLPPSSSCFLLLRVFGTEGDNSSKLRELSAPLLQHVQKTVTGAFGRDGAIRVINLLLADVADKKPVRRRCARRVLQETLAEQNLKVNDRSFDAASCTWLHGILLLDHVNTLLPHAIKHVSAALSHERGQALRALVLSLNQYIELSAKRNIDGQWDFPNSLCDLISSRSIVCAEAFDRFSDLRQLAISTVHAMFKSYLEGSDSREKLGNDCEAQFRPCRSYRNGTVGSIRLPLALLQSTCVLLSIWRDTGNSDDGAKESVNELANILMSPYDSPKMLLLESSGLEGVASATLAETGYPAVTVDEWVMLAKSRSDNIARRAALSAPSKFLPRLLLCSGLPQSSLLTMIDRLGKLGETGESEEKVFRELLMPSTVLDWGFGQIGTRREIARKLLGRLSAYLSMSGETTENLSKEISFTFIAYLSEECRPPERSKKGRPLKKAIKAGLASDAASQLADTEYLLTSVPSVYEPNGELLASDKNESSFFKDFSLPEQDSPSRKKSSVDSFILGCCAKYDSDSIEAWIQDSFSAEGHPEISSGDQVSDTCDQLQVAILLLDSSLRSAFSNPEWNRAVERWVPVLTKRQGNPRLWRALFSQHESELDTQSIISSCCFSWCPMHSDSCRKWLLSNVKELRDSDCQAAVNFLLQTSGEFAPHAPSFHREAKSIASWLQEKETIDSLVKIAFESAKQAGQVIVHRNGIPAWLQLLLLVSQAGKRQANHMVNALLVLIEEANHEGLRRLMGEAILRIYAYYPLNVSLSSPSLRTLLIDVSRSTDWRSWRTQIDETTNDLLSGLKLAPSQRLVQGLLEISKGHPLMLIRKLDVITQILEKDACTSSGGTSRARVQGEYYSGSTLAAYNCAVVKVNIRHWGYCYTDPLWTSFIDLLLSVPKEVLFSCGSVMGLHDFLAVYVKLFYVQSELKSGDKLQRLKARFGEVLSAFEKDTGWNDWLASTIPELDSVGSVRNILIRCSLITTNQAMENIRARQEG